MRVADGQGDTGQPAACADVEQTGLGHEPEELGDGQAMGQMLELQTIGVLARDEVDLGIPITQKFAICLEPDPVFISQVGKPTGEVSQGSSLIRHSGDPLVDGYRRELLDQVVHLLGLAKKVFELAEGERRGRRIWLGRDRGGIRERARRCPDSCLRA